MMTVGVGLSGMPSYMPPGGLSSLPYATLLGRPVIPCEYCQTAGTVGDILLVDLSAYATGVAGGIDSASSIHLRFDWNETCFRWIFRVDGESWLAHEITPLYSALTQSPFIALAVRA
jgi:HK97 family phage major capsid protein